MVKKNAGIRRLLDLSNKAKRRSFVLADINWHITNQGPYARVLRLVGFPFARLEFKMWIPGPHWCFQGFFKIDSEDRLIAMTTSEQIELYIMRAVKKMRGRINQQ